MTEENKKPEVLEEGKPDEKTEGKKGRGRPAGSQNKPKSEKKTVTKARKAGPEYADPRSAIKRKTQELNDTYTAYGKKEGKHFQPVKNQLEEPFKFPEPLFPVDECSALMVVGCEMLGEMLQVEARPSQKSVERAGASIARLSGYFVFVPPVYIAAGSAVITTGMCVYPMFKERADKLKVEEVATIEA